MSLLVNSLIQITSSLEESYVHELCSDWYDPYTVFTAPYSLSRGNTLKFISLRNINSWIYTAPLPATSSHTDRWTSYTSVNKYNLNSRLAHFNALWMEHIHSFRTGIMAEYPVMSTSQGPYGRIEQMLYVIEIHMKYAERGRGGWGLGLGDAGLSNVSCLFKDP